GELLERRVGPDAFVAIEESRAVLTADLDGDDLALEASLLGGARRTAVRLQREAVVVLAGKAPLLGDELGRDALRHQATPLLIAGEDVGPEGKTAGLDRLAHRHPRHALDAGGDHDVVRAGH